MRLGLCKMANCLAAVAFGIVSAGFSATFAQGPNYDESKVPCYELPELLVSECGIEINTPEAWKNIRRPEILKQFQKTMFGKYPEADLSKLKFEEISSYDKFLDGKATVKTVRVYFNAPEKTPKMDLMVVVPNNRSGAVPAFLMPNFQGNHTTTDDPNIPAFFAEGSTHNRGKAPEEVRGIAKSRWAYDKIIAAGYAIVTVFYEEIDPDFDDGFQNGVHPLFTNFSLQNGDYPATISAWAWGLSRALDCLETIPEIDAEKVIVLGHSRLGKTALWCGANDERFAAVVSNDSGCGGAALSRREFGETVKKINTTFPHWFCANFHEYGDCVNALPIDEHELIALIAPRPVYVASATEDLWADPKGEFLSALNAEPVYRLFELEGLGVDEQPDPDEPVGTYIRYHLRTGKHDVTDFDWEQYIKFANFVFSAK
ncbi:MAG: acetylxylan esterase [Thermoguttaceae bacterium]|nr:acetylxylan esterase [Thermoguttaceae bacterium]